MSTELTTLLQECDALKFLLYVLHRNQVADDFD